ncbi:MAG: hypothetical protein ACO3DK_00865 [Bacteroidia bacterium]
MKSYYAAGKVMLIGEYAVKMGIEALALPVRVGQHLRVWEYDSPDADTLIYRAFDCHNEPFVDLRLPLPLGSEALDAQDDSRFVRRAMALTRAGFWKPGKSYRFETHLEFERSSGLGSSSTLIALWAQATGMNAQSLQAALLGGSGYDVAVAELGKPLVYWLKDDEPHWDTWSLDPAWTADWLLLSSGTKIDSRKSLAGVKERLEALSEDAFTMAQLQKTVDALKNAGHTAMLESGLEWWQALLYNLLGLETPYQTLGLKPIKGGMCKWLGAWGGDTLLVNRAFLNEYADQFADWHQQAWSELVIHA